MNTLSFLVPLWCLYSKQIEDISKVRPAHSIFASNLSWIRSPPVPSGRRTWPAVLGLGAEELPVGVDPATVRLASGRAGGCSATRVERVEREGV